MLEPDYESSSSTPGKTPQSLSGHTHNSCTSLWKGNNLTFNFVPFSSRFLVAEFAEYEMICKALRTEHQELQEDMISLKQVVHQLEHLHKEYQVCVCACVRACVCAKECRGTNMCHYRHEHRHTHPVQPMCSLR